MPNDFVAHGLSFDPDEEARKKKRTQPGPQTDLGLGQLGHIEKVTHGTLPTKVSWALTSMKDRQDLIEKAAKLIAKRFDVQHHYIYGADQLKDYLDPIFDGKLKMSTVRRITGDFQIPALEGILREAGTKQVGPHGGRGIDNVTAAVDPRTISAYIRAFTPYIDANNIDATEGISMAVYLAQNGKGVNVKDFKQNLGAIFKWVTDTSQPKDKFGWTDQMMLALKASKDKVKLGSNVDVVRFLSPGLAAVADKQNQPTEPGLDISGDPVAQQLKKTATAEENRAGNPSAANITTDFSTLAYVPTDQAHYLALDEIQPQSKDFYAYATALQDQLKFDETAFQNSFVGKGLDWFGRSTNFIWKDIIEEGIITNVGTGIDLAGKGLGAALPGGPSLTDAYRATFNDRKYLMTRLDTGSTLGNIAREGYSEAIGDVLGREFQLPNWTAGAFDFFVGWEVDPFTIFGKVKGFAREARLVPGTLDKTTLLGSVAKKVAPTAYENRIDAIFANQTGKFTDRLNEFVSSPTSRDLFDASLNSDYQMLRRMDTLRTTIEARSPLDRAFMTALRDRMIARYGLENIINNAGIAEKAWQEWQDGMRAHFVGFGPEGSVAQEAVLTRLGASRTALDKLLTADPVADLTGEQLALPFKDIPPAQVVDETLRTMWDQGYHPAFRQEIPLEAHWVPGLGFTQKLSTAFPGSALGATKVGERAERLFTINPGRVFNASDAPERYVMLHSRRWLLPEEVTRDFERRALEIVNSGIHVNKNLFGLVDELDKMGFEATVSRYNLSQAAKDELYQAIYEPTHSFNSKERVFGVADDSAPLREPLLETQLQYTRLVVDPIQAQKAVKQYVGTLRRMRNALVKALPGEHLPAEIAAAGNAHALASTFDTLGEAARAYRRTWKAGAVARPGYIPRVIFLDEGARSLATTQSVFERMLAQKFSGEAAQTKIGRAVGRAEEATVGRVADSGLFDQTIKIGDEVVTIPRPGAYAYEPLAVGKIRETEIVDETLKNASMWNKAMQADGSWTIVKPGQVQYWDALKNALTREFANSAPGQVALEAIRDGKSIEEARSLLKQWAARDNYVTLETNLGIDRAGINEWADNVTNMAYGYTGRSAEIADAVLNKVPGLDKLLRAKMDLDHLPEVHGPSLNMLLGGTGTPVGTKVVNGAYRYLVQLPEDVLNRQPTYAIWKRRAELSYYRAYGKEVEATSSLNTLDEVRNFVNERINNTLAMGEEAYTTKSLRAAQTLRGGEDLGEGIKVLRKADGKTYYADVEEGRVVGFRSISKDGRVETIVDPAYQRQGIGTKLLKAHWRDEGVTNLAQAKALIAKQQFTEAGAALNLKALKELIPEASGLAPEVVHAIDIASREFSLAQVKKIMFDFSEQRRFQELMGFMVPFSQPFFEGFQAWGNIALRRAPETIGRARVLWKLGQDTGFIRKDQYGNDVIPLTALFKPAMWAGLLPDSFSFVTPVTSLNMLAQSTIPVTTRGFLGKVAGGAPIPVPSTDPLATLVFQRMFSDSTNDAINAAFFQHGPNATLLPPTLYKALSIIDPAATGDDAKINAYALNFLEFYQFAHLHEDLSPEELKAQARADAQTLNTVRVLGGLVSPGAPQIQWPQTEVKQEFYDDIETMGYEEGKAEFLKHHPDLWLLTLGHTVWTKDFEGRDQVRIPTSTYAAKLLGSGPVADIARKYPEYGALFLIGADPALAQQYDFATAARLAADGTTRYKSLDRFLDEGQSAAAWGEVDKFNRTYYLNLDNLTEQGLSDDNAAVVALRKSRIEFLTHLQERFPLWGRDNLKPVVDSGGNAIGYDWKYEGDTPPPTLLLAHARQLVTIPELKNFPGIKAMSMYLTGRDDIAAKMRNLGISDLGSRAAQEAGIVDSYDKLKADVTKAYPDFAPFLYNYFAGDLTGTPSNDLAGAFKLDQTTYDRVVKLDTQYERLTDQGRTADFKYQRSAAYQDARDLLDKKYAQDPKLVQTWWDTQLTSQERKDYVTNLAFRPVAFYSQWDFKQMGVKMTDKASEILTAYGKSRVEIQRKDELNPDFAAGDAYDRLDHWLVAQAQGKGPDATALKKAITAMNTWGWGAEKAGLTKQPGKTGQAWGAAIDFAQTMQKAFDKGQFTTYDPEWQKGRLAVLDYVKQLRKWSPGFDAQWTDFQENNNSGDPLIYWLIPDVYFPVTK